jgi:hypothetical protein
MDMRWDLRLTFSPCIPILTRPAILISMGVRCRYCDEILRAKGRAYIEGDIDVPLPVGSKQLFLTRALFLSGWNPEMAVG